MGYRIPKDAIVIGNHWSIHLDEEVYENPMEFRPRRWIENPDLPLMPFGFGRRICTGQHIARNSLFINIARILWTFNIEYKYENGKRLEVDPMAFSQGFNSRQLPFNVCFKVRSLERLEIVEKAYSESEKDINVILGSFGKYSSKV
jgi:cytochrome P450